MFFLQVLGPNYLGELLEAIDPRSISQFLLLVSLLEPVRKNRYALYMRISLESQHCLCLMS